VSKKGDPFYLHPPADDRKRRKAGRKTTHHTGDLEAIIDPVLYPYNGGGGTASQPQPGRTGSEAGSRSTTAGKTSSKGSSRHSHERTLNGGESTTTTDRRSEASSSGTMYQLGSSSSCATYSTQLSTTSVASSVYNNGKSAKGPSKTLRDDGQKRYDRQEDDRRDLSPRKGSSRADEQNGGGRRSQEAVAARGSSQEQRNSRSQEKSSQGRESVSFFRILLYTPIK
jgi:hypothetical protein